MKAFVMRSYGPPDLLTLTDIDQPVPAEGEVLVRVRATSINPYDWHHLRGEPRVARLMGGSLKLRRAAFDVLGADLAGEVEAVGSGVTQYKAGDRVYALLKSGGFGEYVSVSASDLVPMPENLSFEEAAAVPMAGCTAFLAVRDDGRVHAGQSVLVIGASGGIGPSPSRSPAPWARRSPACAAPATSTSSGPSAPSTSSITPHRTSRSPAASTTSSSTSPAAIPPWRAARS
jgi:NADPH:quinone reductase-like Zn-dependent oxidoreductase